MEKMKDNNNSMSPFKLKSNTDMKKILSIIVIFFAVMTVFFSVFATRDFMSMQNVFESEGNSECVPYGIFVESVESTSVTLVWRTKGKCLSFVKYGTDSTGLLLTAISEDSLHADQLHKVTVGELDPRTTYYFSVVTEEGEFGVAGSPLTVETEL